MQSFADVWEKALEVIRPKVTSVSYDSWIQLLKPVKMEKNIAYFYVRTLFQKGTVKNNFTDIIEQALLEVMGFEIKIEIITEEDAPPRIIEQAKENEEHLNETIHNNISTAFEPQDTLTFDNFIVGNENKFAYAAALAVANDPGNLKKSDDSFNPLFIYGRSGLGKTHLMSAIANKIRSDNPNAKIKYIKAEDFMNDLMKALEEKKMEQFRTKYRELDAFFVDDIQFIGDKKEFLMEEFFYTFETLHQAKKQIVLTSDRSPKDMVTLTDRLRTRFCSGIITDIQPPDFETRCAIIANKAKKIGFADLDTKIVEFIANKLQNNVRELEGAINYIKVKCRLLGCRPNIEIANDAIKQVISENSPSAITPELIIDMTGRYFNISTEDIKGIRRTANITNARQVAMYICREMTPMSLEDIGKEFGGKDHTTVMHSTKKVESTIKLDPKLNRSVNEIMENIKKSF